MIEAVMAARLGTAGPAACSPFNAAPRQSLRRWHCGPGIAALAAIAASLVA
jgi:hypothetical protein